jgi:hypothetical protein
VPGRLLLEHFFNLTHFLLDLTAKLLNFAFSLHIGIVDDVAGHLLDLALDFMKLAFDLIFRARIHLFSLLRASQLEQMWGQTGTHENTHYMPEEV